MAWKWITPAGLVFADLDVPDLDQVAQPGHGYSGEGGQVAGQVGGEPAPQLARVSVEEDGSLIVIAFGAERPAEPGVVLAVAPWAGNVAAMRAAAFLVITARPARQQGFAAHTPRVHRAEGRGGEGCEHARVPGYGRRDALAAGEPGADELAGVLLVDLRAGRADGFAAVAARHQPHPARLGGGVIHGPPLSGGQIDSVGAASNPDRPGAATTAGGLASIVSQLSPGQGERGAAAGSAQTQTPHSRWGYRADRDRRHAAALQ
jgi:hypothetical protein